MSFVSIFDDLLWLFSPKNKIWQNAVTKLPLTERNKERRRIKNCYIVVRYKTMQWLIWITFSTTIYNMTFYFCTSARQKTFCTIRWVVAKDFAIISVETQITFYNNGNIYLFNFRTKMKKNQSIFKCDIYVLTCTQLFYLIPLMSIKASSSI